MLPVEQPPVNLQTLADRLKVLAEPKRLLILHFLMEGVQCNCELGDALQMAPNLISHHLKVLREAGLVNDRRAGRWVHYSLRPEVMEEIGTFIREHTPGPGAWASSTCRTGRDAACS